MIKVDLFNELRQIDLNRTFDKISELKKDIFKP